MCSGIITTYLSIEDFEVSADDRKQIVEVVRDSARELADCFHFLRLA